MPRITHLALPMLLGLGLVACAGPKPAPATAAPAPTHPVHGAAATPVPTPAAAEAPPAPPPVAKLDSTGSDPRPEVLVDDMDYTGVRTRLIPHVMGKGWMLSVNKGDSIEFQRPAEAGLTQMLFGLVPPPGSRIRLRFRLTSVPEGVKIATMGHLLGANGPYPYKASKEILALSLEELKGDLKSAPVYTEPQVDRVKPRKK
jgi:hypothetical protein